MIDKDIRQTIIDGAEKVKKATGFMPTRLYVGPAVAKVFRENYGMIPTLQDEWLSYFTLNDTLIKDEP